MTITTLVIVNAILGFAVVAGIVSLLASGIHGERSLGHVLELPEPELDRLVA